MATTGSGVWVNSEANRRNSVPDYDFYSGEFLTTDDYADNEIVFGFRAGEVIIVNVGANRLALQWPRLKGEPKDSGIVEPGETVTFRRSMKDGVLIRSESAGSPTTCYVMAV